MINRTYSRRKMAIATGTVATFVLGICSTLLNAGPISDTSDMRGSRYENSILGTAALQAIRALGSRCGSRYDEFLLANFSRVFVATGNDHCFYAYDMPDDASALDAVKSACREKGATNCDILITNSTFPKLSIEFVKRNDEIGELKLDPDMFYFSNEHAKGAVIWAPGRNDDLGRKIQITSVKSPNYLRAFNNSGWDIYHYYAPPTPTSGDEDAFEKLTFEHFDASIMHLKERGYKKLLLAGHSWGASLMLARMSRLPDIDGVIATAPAFARTYPPSEQDTRVGLRLILSSINAVDSGGKRFAIVFLQYDNFNPDPAVRLAAVAGVLKAKGFPALLLEPTDDRLTGHDGAEGFDFALRYGRCVVDFFERETGPRAGCAPAQ